MIAKGIFICLYQNSTKWYPGVNLFSTELPTVPAWKLRPFPGIPPCALCCHQLTLVLLGTFVEFRGEYNYALTYPCSVLLRLMAGTELFPARSLHVRLRQETHAHASLAGWRGGTGAQVYILRRPIIREARYKLRTWCVIKTARPI